ncbi:MULTISPECIES: DUF6612 family protein [unclassified Paenibacillus]|uniref:DUF6612 family protein n=1 Tax=unclassified Paenibacillus TaxID=185978 RepID=UPI00240679F5|nr:MULTISPECIES: DUF6612 family protein [unclassified Paenibacillus]MDF9843139.1 hypothetical protein [Paenibacillus sp. PastF-2]MDF9849649.1 hypothetical protein [Paenibacillus sp. PastM-2]MDF9856433.1 hypothetical protein [Paenibacillus sp. PastF-1]MDH6481705.1 hypothetical protein [Paenibacillus sp. PastH-2]MDH6508986.1 hypothetical protein [Paenibacillus sp. PastM-3]
MKKVLKTIGTSLVAGALLLSGAAGGVSGPGTVSAAAAKAPAAKAPAAKAPAAKAPTADQVISKVAAAAKTLKNFHIDVTKKQDVQSGGVKISNINTLNLDINRLPAFAAAGSVKVSLLETSYELYANDKEFYYLVDGSELIADSEENYEDSEDGSSTDVVTDGDGEPIDPDAQYWIDLEKEEWETFYSKSQYDPAAILDSVKAYKKSMKVSTAGTQTVMQFTLTDPAAAKAVITLYDQENLWDSETLLPKSVTWKVFVNTKTWQTEKLTVDLSYVLAADGAKDTYTTKIEAKYSKNNKTAPIVKPAELE